ncbi:DUF6965 family protein [Sphingobacterium suaedae]|uniref:DUF6965 family protein n=1 Tax=Sphingobacterium suaedae TaxID=1686402 RepID=A0ABW5KHF6_9SPHI
MTIEELKAALLDKEFPERVEIGPDQIVTDHKQFLKTQFIMVGQWNDKKPLDRCPAYLRLVKFWEAVR